MNAKQLYDEALWSYRAYLVIASSQPADTISLKWPDIAKAAIDGDVDLLRSDLEWMIYEPLRICYNSILERVVQEMGKPPARFAIVSTLSHEISGGPVASRDILIDKIDELLGLLQTVTGKRYVKIREVIHADHGDDQRLCQRQ